MILVTKVTKNTKDFKEGKMEMKKTICFFVALVGAGVVSLPLMADTETGGG